MVEVLDRKVVSLVVAALAAGLLLGCVVGYLGADVSSLTQRIESLEGQVDDLNSQLDAADSELDYSSLRISQLNSLMAQKNATIGSLNSQITSLNLQLSALRTEKTALTQQVLSLESTVTLLESQVQTRILGVHFSPHGGCEQQLLNWIGRANSTIEVLIYSFTLDSIGDALIEAHERGVQVQVVFEVSQISQYSEYMKLKAAGIEVRNDTNSEAMHDKVMIVDGIIVLTGSYNYSENAEERNNENLLIINSTTVATTYGQEFAKIWDESLAAEEEEETPPTPPPQQLDIEISYINYDAPGDDWDNLNGEYVTIQNSGSENADLTGWRLVDAASHTFTFPSFTLAPGSTVTVYTGSGTNTQTSLYWGSSSPIWNNDHDTAYLYDSSGELIDSYSW